MPSNSTVHRVWLEPAEPLLASMPALSWTLGALPPRCTGFSGSAASTLLRAGVGVQVDVRGRREELAEVGAVGGSRRISELHNTTSEAICERERARERERKRWHDGTGKRHAAR